MFSYLRNPVTIALSTGSVVYAASRSRAFCAAANNSECTSAVKRAVARPSRSPLTSVKDKVVLITGATAGIGAAIAWRFAEEGSRLVLVGRREERLSALKSELTTAYPGLKVHTVSLSVTDYKAVAALPNALPADFKDVEVLVNNAGLARGVTTVENNSMEDAVEVLDTNVLGTIALCSAFLPGMKQRGKGHVVNMGSVAVSLYHINLLFISL